MMELSPYTYVAVAGGVALFLARDYVRRFVRRYVVRAPLRWLMYRSMRNAVHTWRAEYLDADTAVEEVQLETLLRLLRANADTERGRALGNSDITSVEEFRARVPLTTYNDYAEAVERLANGESTTILSHEAPVYFATSSGTTGKAKLLPITQGMMDSLTTGMRLSIGSAVHSGVYRPSPLRRSFFIAVGRNDARTPRTKGGVMYGPLSQMRHRVAMVNSFKTWFMSLMTCTPTDIIEDLEHFEACMIVQTLVALAEPDLEVVLTAFAPALVHVIHLIKQYGLAMAAAIRAGDCALVPPIKEHVEPCIRARIDHALRSEFSPSQRAARADHLDRILRTAARPDDRGAGNGNANALARQIWPELQCLSVATCGPFRVYRAELDEFAGGLPYTMGVYMASEGSLGAQLESADDQYVLLATDLFFEFIPEQFAGEAVVETLLMHELEEGARYEVVLTNIAGFSRYRLGDVVEVARRYPNGWVAVTPCYRSGSLLDALGEKTSEQHVIGAIDRVEKRWGASVAEFTARVCTDTAPMRYEVFVELRGEQASGAPGDGDDEQRVLSAEELSWLDEELQTVNDNYEGCRSANKIGALNCVQVCTGTFERWVELLVSGGVGGAQVKVPHLLKNPAHVEFIRQSAVCSQ